MLDDLNIIGVRDPSTGETGYGVVMGSGGTLFGLCLYRGVEGFETYRKLVDEEPDFQADEFYATQNCLKLELDSRRNLHPEDLDVIRQLGLSFKGRHAWPQFRSLSPGFAPWFLTEAEATFLKLALEAICHHFEKVVRREIDESSRENQCLVYSPATDAHSSFTSRWEPWPQPLPPRFRLPVLDLARINGMLANKPKPDSPWEAGVFFLPSTIHDRDRPYFTRIACVCQQVSGFAFAFDLMPPETSIAQALADTICASVERHGFLPETLFVMEKETATSLMSLGKALGIKILHREHLQTIESLKAGLLGQLLQEEATPRKTRAVPAGSTIYQMKVTLRGSDPQIWRRFLVPADYTLAKLHRVLQAVMGWEEVHLHEFNVAGQSFGRPDPEFGSEIISDKKVTLKQVAPKRGSKFMYIYDFGDDWRHDLKVEKILDVQEGERNPRCIEGMRACPPEDCGGIWGYTELLEAIQNPATIEQRGLLEWAADFDPEWFDLEAVNKRLRRMK